MRPQPKAAEKASRPGRRADATTFVALVRGINVGRAKQVAMAELRALVESLGYTDVRTLLRSGNILFRSPDGDPARIGRAIQDAITERLGLTAGVIVRTADDLAAVVASNPMPDAASDRAFLHVMFLAAPLEPSERTALEAAHFGPDEVRLADREIYVWYRSGMSGSDTAGRLGKLVRTLATDRNWNTVEKLLAMARAT